MNLTLIDFLIGFFLMNAMPHLLCGLWNIRFFNPFGFSAQGNLAYAAINVIVALVLYHVEYGIGTLMGNGIMIGALAMLLIYTLTGRFFYNLFHASKQA